MKKNQIVSKPAKKRLRTLVIEDHRLYREFLIELLADQPSVAVVGEAGTAEEGLKQIKKLSPNLVTIDINLPGMDGFALTRILKRHYPELKIIFISLNGNPYYHREAKKLACPYVPKENLMEELPPILSSLKQF